jgi:hypothetical protein
MFVCLLVNYLALTCTYASGYLPLDAACTFVYSSVVVHWSDLQRPDPGSYSRFVAGVVEGEFFWTHDSQQTRCVTQRVGLAAEGSCLGMLRKWLAAISVTV